MNSLDRKFKITLDDFMNQRFMEAQAILCLPVSTETSKDLHEIGVLRGYLKALKEVAEESDIIMTELLSPEKPLEKKQ